MHYGYASRLIDIKKQIKQTGRQTDRQTDKQWLWFGGRLLSAPDVGIFGQVRCSYLPRFAAVEKRKRSAISPAEFLEIVR